MVGSRRDVLDLCLSCLLDLCDLCLGSLGSVVPARCSVVGSCPGGPCDHIEGARSCPRLGQAAESSEALMAEAAMVGSGMLVALVGSAAAAADSGGADSRGCCGGALPSCFLVCGVDQCLGLTTSVSVLLLSLAS